MIKKVYSPPVSPAPITKGTIIALGCYAAFLIGLYGVGVASLI